MFHSIHRMIRLALPLLLLASSTALRAQQPTAPPPVTLEELAKKVEALTRELQELRRGRDPLLQEMAQKIEVLSQELERVRLGDSAATAIPEVEAADIEGKPLHGMGPAAAKVHKTKSGLSIGGYGESVYQNFDPRKDDGTPSAKVNEWDYLRGVLYVGWKFPRRFVFNSELEFEHGSTGTGKSGEVSVEFATLDAMIHPAFNLRAGMVLAPVGFLNELHEPSVYFGARRPDVESQIIPSTWRMNGIGFFGEAGPFAYKFYLTEGLDGKKFTAGSGLRSGRQNGAKAKADDLGFTGRVDWISVPGLTAGVSFYRGRSGQDLKLGGADVKAETTLFDLHADYRWRGLALRGVYAQGRIGDAALLNRSNSILPGSNLGVGERIEGYYLQAGYDIFSVTRPDGDSSLSPFVRYEWLDTQKRVPFGYARNPANQRKVMTYGIDYKPIPQVVFKFDYQDQWNGARTGVDQFNAAIGYLF